jgi:GxxExxY protein
MNLQDRIQDMVNEIQFTLGAGHTRSVYQTALTIALQDANLFYETDKSIPITFRNRFVGTLTADIIVDCRLVIMMCGYRDELMDQCTMYKRLSQYPFGMIIIFTSQGPIVEPC